jgi:hypothetical protein
MTAGANASAAAPLAYAQRGWGVFPVGHDKRPMSSHGRSDATIDPDVIGSWWRRWPQAGIALATGAEAGVVALDVDIDPDAGVDGRQSLEALGVCLHPITPTSHTPRGGYHMLFAHPGAGIYVKTIAGKLGPGLDIRGDGGSIILPPGPGRFWDPHLDLKTVPLAPFPAWARIPEPAPEPAPARPALQRLSRYGEVALDSACRSIALAPSGTQEGTLNRECYGIGQLVGGGVIPLGAAEQMLAWAATQMPSHDRHRPWRQRDLVQKVRNALVDGAREPRRPAHAGG